MKMLVFGLIIHMEANAGNYNEQCTIVILTALVL